MKLPKWIILGIFLIFSFVLSACDSDDLGGIQEPNTFSVGSFFIEDFSLDDVDIIIDNERVTLNEDWISESDLSKLNRVGNHTLTVDINGTLYSVSLELKENENERIIVTFKDLNQVTLKEVEVNTGESVEAPDAPEVYGYRFLKWSHDLNNLKRSITVTPLYEKETFTITLNLNNGILEEHLISALYNALIELPIPEKEGYNFIGWYTGNNEFDERVSNIFKLEYSLPLYARWEAKMYTVQFLNIEGQLIDTVIVPYFGEVLPPAIEDKLGYTFIGWDNELVNVTQNLIVSPIYEPISYTITFDYENFDDIEVLYNTPLTTIEQPEKEGYVFSGWYLDEALTIPLTMERMPANDLYLYPKFEVRTYTVSFENNILPAFSIRYGETIPYLPTFTALDQTHVGWTYDDEIVKMFEPYRFKKDIVLSPLWVGVDAGITYEIEDEKVIITGYTGSNTHLYIPSEIEGTPVKEIAYGAFRHHNTLEVIHIAEGLTTIHERAFEHAVYLREVIIPPSVSYIGRYAFNYVTQANIHIGLNQPPMSWHEDWNPFGEEYVNPPSDNYNRVFWNLFGFYEYEGFNFSLTYDHKVMLTSPDELHRVIDNLTLSLPSHVYDLEVYGVATQAFSRATGFTTLEIPNSIQILDANSFFRSEIETLIIEEGSNLREIGRWAFAHVPLSGDLRLPASLETIGTLAFYQVFHLTGLSFEEGSQLKSIGSNAFQGAFSQERNPNKVNILMLPESLEIIGNFAFFENPYLDVIYLPAMIEDLPLNIFMTGFLGSDSYIPDPVTIITNFDYGTFENQSNPIRPIQQIVSDQVWEEILIIDGIIYGIYEQQGNRYVDVITALPGLFDTPILVLPEMVDGASLRSINSFAFEPVYDVLEQIFIPKTVEVIEDFAFSTVSELSTVRFAEGSQLKEIGNYAFLLTSLREIKLPENLESIGEGAFQFNDNMTVFIPESVINIGENAFEGAYRTPLFFQGSEVPSTWHETIALSSRAILFNVQEYGYYESLGYKIYDDEVTILHQRKDTPDEVITLPSVIRGNPVTKIHAYAFYNLEHLHTVNFEDESNLTTIGEYAFAASNLVQLVIPNSVVSIGNNAFSRNRLNNVFIPITVEYIGENAFFEQYNQSGILADDITIRYEGSADHPNWDVNWNSDDYTVVYDSLVYQVFNNTMFKYGYMLNGNVMIMGLNQSVDDLVIPYEIDGRSVTHIGGYAFSSTDLRSVYIPNSVTVIGRNAFVYSTVESIVFEENSQLEIIERYAFGWSNLKSIHIPRSVSLIGNWAFADSSLEALSFEENSQLEIIERYAFLRSNLTEVTIPQSVTLIEMGAFANTNLSTLLFEEQSQLITIENYVFNLTNLSNINLPKGIKNIHQGAFSETLVTSVYIPLGVEVIGIDAFTNRDDESFVIVIQELAFEVDWDTSLLDDYARSYFGYDNLLGLYSNEDLVYGVTLEEEVIIFGLSRTTNNEDLTIPLSIEDRNVVGIVRNAFEEASLKDVVLPSSMRFIGREAFMNSTLRSINIPVLITEIETRTFFNANQLETVVFDEGSRLNTIRDSAFRLNSALGSLQLPKGLEIIEQHAFRDHFKLIDVYIPSTVTSMGTYAFSGAINNQLETVIFGEGSVLTQIQNFTFFRNPNLESIIIPQSVFLIGTNAFSSTGLKDITFSENADLSIIGNYAFANTQLTEIIIPESVTLLGDGAFLNVATLVEVVILRGHEEGITELGFASANHTAFMNTSPELLIYVLDDSFDYYYFDNDWFIFGVQLRNLSEKD